MILDAPAERRIRNCEISAPFPKRALLQPSNGSRGETEVIVKAFCYHLSIQKYKFL
jgi:hypothetical protein